MDIFNYISDQFFIFILNNMFRSEKTGRKSETKYVRNFLLLFSRHITVIIIVISVLYGQPRFDSFLIKCKVSVIFMALKSCFSS